MTILKPETLQEIQTLSQNNPNRLFILDFKATWCRPCKQIYPQIEKWASEMPDVSFCVIDVEDDEHQDTTCQFFNISAMPTFVFLKNNQVLSTFCGADVEKINRLLNQLR
jgi:thioredoxin 1